jgi:hypothetical protein
MQQSSAILSAVSFESSGAISENATNKSTVFENLKNSPVHYYKQLCIFI